MKEEGPSAVEKEARMMLSVKPMSGQKNVVKTLLMLSDKVG